MFVIRTPESFAGAREARLSVSGNPSQYGDLQVFIEEQAPVHRLLAESILPALELIISDNHVAGAPDRIAD